MSQTSTHTPSLVSRGMAVVRVPSLKKTDLSRSPSGSPKASKATKTPRAASANLWIPPSAAPRSLDVQFEDAFLRLVQNRPQPKPTTGQFGSWNKEWPVFWEGAGLGPF